jgi:glycosyltransferase involved in cell wall biosynthesis
MPPPDASPATEHSPSANRSSVWRTARDVVFEHVFAVPDRQRWWRTPALGAPISARPDLVYATGGPWTSLLIGEALARRYKVPFVADFRDPWTRNPGRVISPSALARARRLERFVCQRAARVVANTEELRLQFVADYPEMTEKFVTITNGFDSSVEWQEPTSTSEPVGGERPIEILHFGTVYGERTPRALLEAIERLHAAGRIQPSAMRLRFVGEWQVDDDECNRLAAQLEAVGLIAREPAVPHAVCLARMRRADVLLVLQGGFNLQVPGKIYEYFSAGRPLWLIGDDGATAALIGRNGLGQWCRNEVAAIQSVLVDLGSGAAVSAPDATLVGRFDYQQLTRRLAAVFEGALAGVTREPSLSPV